MKCYWFSFGSNEWPQPVFPPNQLWELGWREGQLPGIVIKYLQVHPYTMVPSTYLIFTKNLSVLFCNCIKMWVRTKLKMSFISLPWITWNLPGMKESISFVQLKNVLLKEVIIMQSRICNEVIFQSIESANLISLDFVLKAFKEEKRIS